MVVVLGVGAHPEDLELRCSGTTPFPMILSTLNCVIYDHVSRSPGDDSPKGLEVWPS